VGERNGHGGSEGNFVLGVKSIILLEDRLVSPAYHSDKNDMKVCGRSQAVSEILAQNTLLEEHWAESDGQ
jgi:hypothetical protein